MLNIAVFQIITIKIHLIQQFLWNYLNKVQTSVVKILAETMINSIIKGFIYEVGATKVILCSGVPIKVIVSSPDCLSLIDLKF